VKIAEDSIVVATQSQISCVLEKDTVILEFEKGHYFGLNEVGTLVWNQIQKPRKVREIQESILHDYQVEPAECGRDVIQLLEQMQNEGLIRVVETPATV
jgi:hypothetical protein